MRVTNIDTISAYLDRLVTENIKLYFFTKENDLENIEHQKTVLATIREKLVQLMTEAYNTKSYDYIGERRTFNESAIIESLEELIINDINIGEADRARLAETTKIEPNLERMVVNEKRLRKANEGRARNKNEIDNLFKNIVE